MPIVRLLCQHNFAVVPILEEYRGIPDEHVLLQALQRYASELGNAFTVITAQKIRIIKYNQ